MRIRMVDITSTPKSLADSMEESPRHTRFIGLQAPTTNTQTVFFGDHKIQPFELRPKANAIIPVASFRELFLVGTPGDKVAVALFDGG